MSRTRTECVETYTMTADAFTKSISKVRTGSKFHIPKNLAKAGRSLALRLYPILSTQQISEVLGINKSTVVRWING